MTEQHPMKKCSEASLPPVAVIGMGCLFPESPGLKAYWRLLYQGKDAVTPVPDTHWPVEDYYDSDPKTPDRVYCVRGGFLSPIAFDPSEYGIPPNVLEATDTSQILGLVAAKMALDDAGYGNGKPFDRTRASVILGVTGTQELVIPLGARLGHPIWRSALEDAGVEPERAESVIQRISDAYVSWQENSFPGLLGNVVAGRICNRLDLGGTNCVVDAACASSMGALNMALMELSAGRSDMVLTGGVDAINDIFMHMCFAKTQILSSTGDIRPFSKHADGTVLGEGVGILVLKRLADAERDGDRIYAAIKGIGASSDGKSQSIYAPRLEGQIKALERAYRSACVDPADVELIEAHGTGTRVGDAVEFNALGRVFGPDGGECALGSVKSMIGHTKAAAGAAGLIKTVLALHHKVLPPTLKAEEPDPELDFEHSPFYLNAGSRPWLSSTQRPRRAGVSAFGFGGSNFHMVLEEHRSAKSEVSWDGSVQIAAFSDHTLSGLREQVGNFTDQLSKSASAERFAYGAARTREAFSPDAPYRLLAALEMPAEKPALVEKLSEMLARCEEAGKPGMFHGNGIHLFFGAGKRPQKIAYVFPGQGSQYPNMGCDIVCTFPRAFEVLAAAHAHFGLEGNLGGAIYPPRHGSPNELPLQAKRLNQTATTQPAVGAVSVAMLETLRWFGISPDAACGHSYGELTALFAAGCIDRETFFDLSVYRGRWMSDAAQKGTATGGRMMAVKGPLSELEALAESEAGLVLANRNSPEQGVLSGDAAAIENAERRCRERGFPTHILPVSAAFHSPHIAEACKPFADLLGGIDFAAPAIPVFANRTALPYPADMDQARQCLAGQMVHPVRFTEQIENMFADGFATFVEVGPKTVLTGLIRATLRGKDFNAFAMDDSAGKGSGLLDLAKTLCRLGSLGHPIRLDRWEDPAEPPRKQRMRLMISGANHRKPGNRKSSSQKTATASGKKKVEREKPQVQERVQNAGDGDIQKEDGAQKANQRLWNEKPMNDPKNNSGSTSEALKAMEDGFKALQSLQMQTAEAHKQFLENQTEISRTLRAMMENAGHLAGLPRASAPACGPPRISEPSQVTAGPNSHPSEPAPAEVSVPVQSPDGTGVRSALLEVVAELTGYPREMLSMDMDIAADLGIDSIKRVEILSTLEEKMPHLPQVSPEVLGELKTLGQIVDFLSEAPPPETPFSAVAEYERDAGIPSVSSSSLPEETRSESAGTPEAAEKNGIRRQAVSVVAETLEAAASTMAIPDRTIRVTDDRTGLSEAIIRSLEARGFSARLARQETVDRIADGASDMEPAAGLILVPPPSTTNPAKELTHAFLMAKHAAPALAEAAKSGTALFAAITRLDGAFGHSGKGMRHPVLGALAGLVKTASLEWEGVACKALDIAPDWQDTDEIAASVVSELIEADAAKRIEVGLRPASRVTLQLQDTAYSDGRIRLAPGETVVISGGARGITAAIAHRLAKETRPRIVLLGRSPEPFPIPGWLEPLRDESAIKQAIVQHLFPDQHVKPAEIEDAFRRHTANREITETLQRLEEAGATVHYCSADVRDPDSVREMLQKVRRNHGPVRALIHAAGVIEDRRIVDKTLPQYRSVFDTKVKGLENLLKALGDDALRYLVLFSSVSARYGNIGQVDYAMANEALNKIALQESVKRPGCRVIALNWGPWDGGMVSPALKREFARKRVPLIPLEDGAEIMLQEMSQEPSAPVEVVIAGGPISEKPVTRSAGRSETREPVLQTAMKREIDMGSCPVLNAHVLDGKPVVPLALMAEWLGHGALHENPGLYLAGLEQLRVLNGIKLDRPTHTVRLMAGRAVRKDARFEVDVELRDGLLQDGTERIHARAKAVLRNALPSPPAFETLDPYVVRPYHRSMEEVYTDILFHGEALQGITEVLGLSDRGMAARLSSAPPPEHWLKKPFRSRWIADPLVLDAAFQMAILWCYESRGVMSLPSYSAAYRQYAERFPDGGVTAAMAVRSVCDRKMQADFTFVGRDNTVVAEIEGLESVLNPSLASAFGRRNAA